MEMSPKNVKRVGLSTLGILSLVVAGCSGREIANHEIRDCEGQIEVDIAPGTTEIIKAKRGGEAKITLNTDGTLTINGLTMGANQNNYQLGDTERNYLNLEIQGDTDGDGRLDMRASSVCQIPATPTPRPTSTPQAQNNGTGKYAAIGRGFFPGKASKPVFTSPRHRI